MVATIKVPTLVSFERGSPKFSNTTARALA